MPSCDILCSMSHRALAKLFEKHGFTGCFIAGDTARTTSSDAQKTIKHYYTTGERGDLPVNPPWTSFTPRPVPHLTYPIVLHAEHISDATMPFFLSPPMPTHLPLVQLLAAYCSLNCSYSDLIALIFIWIRSIDLPQLTPTCIALMVIGYLQVRTYRLLAFHTTDFVIQQGSEVGPQPSEPTIHARY